jgi:hypothetical protein
MGMCYGDRGLVFCLPFDEQKATPSSRQPCPGKRGLARGWWVGFQFPLSSSTRCLCSGPKMQLRIQWPHLTSLGISLNLSLGGVMQMEQDISDSPNAGHIALKGTSYTCKLCDNICTRSFHSHLWSLPGRCEVGTVHIRILEIRKRKLREDDALPKVTQPLMVH